MKKLVLILVFAMFYVLAYSQATPSNHFRIANATTAFGINIAKGTTVYDVGAGKYYVCTAASASTLTLTTGSANFTQIGGSTGTVTSVATNTGSGITGGTITSSGTLAIDTTNVIETKTLATSQLATKWGKSDTASTLETKTYNNSKLALKATKADTANQVRVWKFDNAGDVLVASGNNAYVAVAGNGTATKKFLSETSGTGSFVTISASDVGAQAAFTSDVVDYEPAADSLTTCHVALNGVPIGAITVIHNGFPLKLTTQFTIQASPNRVRISIPVYAYDKIEVAYKY